MTRVEPSSSPKAEGGLPSIPGYEILEKIGEGSMGTVYRAKQIALDRVVAIKVLRAPLAREERYLERLQREAKLTSRLDHPNVVKGIDYGLIEGRPYFVMEYAPGKTLKELLREKGRFSQQEAIEIALQVASALEHAYRHGIVHRDVKPGNLVLTNDGVVKLTDLGLARRPGDPTVTFQGTTMGTPQYISPEQARNPSAVDVRSDIYSLGATLYHLVTGSPPFAGESLADLLTKVLFERAQAASEREPSVSEGFSLVLRKMLAKEASSRYQTPAELVEDLKRIQNHTAPLVTENSLKERHLQISRVAMAGIVGGVLCLGVLLYWVAQDRGKVSPVSPPSLTNIAALEELKPVDSASLAENLARYEKARELSKNVERSASELATLSNLVKSNQDLLLRQIRRTITEGSARISEMLAAKRYRELDSAFADGFASFFESSQQIPLSRLRQGSPELLSEWDSWFDREKRIFEERLQKASEFFANSARRQIALQRNALTGLIATNRFQSASQELEWKIQGFQDEEGNALEVFPASKNAAGNELKAFYAEMSAKIRSSSESLTQGVIAEVQKLQKTAGEKLDTGIASDVIREFETAAAKTLERWKISRAELPAEQGLLLERSISTATAELSSRQETLQKETASRVLRDLDREFSLTLKQRNYEKVLAEWKPLLNRSALDTVSSEIRLRVRELSALVGLREKFGQAINRSQDQMIQVREGAIWKSGKPVHGFDFRTGEFVLEQEKGVKLVCSFSTVHLDTIGRLCGFQDPKTGQDLDSLSGEDLYSWAVFYLYEENLTRARSLFEKYSRKEGSPDWLAPVFARISAQEKKSQERSEQREKEAKDVLDSARRLGFVGEFTRAQAKYAELFRDFGTVEFVKNQRAALETELNQLVDREKTSAKENALRNLFPDAEILPLEGNRFSLRYRFQRGLPGNWKMSEAWVYNEGGVKRKRRCENANEFRTSSGPQISLPLALANGVKVSFRVTFPFDAGVPFFSTFTVAGHTFAFLSGGEKPVGQIASWSGGPESYESHFQHPGWSGDAVKNSGKFRFLRGGSYEVMVLIASGGKDAKCWIDGEELLSSHLTEASPALRDRVEFRSWESAELREVVVEGVSGESK